MKRLIVTFRDNGRVRGLALTVDYFSLSDDGTLTYGECYCVGDWYQIGEWTIPGVLVLSVH